jgi:hypothetical protein
MENNWKYFCQKLDVDVALDGFVGVDNDAIVVQNLIEEKIVSEIVIERN